MISRIKNGRGESAMYDDEHNRYWSGTDTDEVSVVLGELIPVTRLISQFHTMSPWQGTPCDVEFGKRVHSIAESCLRSQKPSLTPSSEDERLAFSALWQYARRIRDNNEVIGIESSLFADGAGVAGTADLVFRCNGRTHLCDWKTGDLMLPAKCKFNAPFSHLVADPLTIYSLQCSMYQVLAEVGGYFDNPSFAPARLLWLHKDDGAWKVDAVTCRDLRREASAMILCRMYTPWFVDWKRRCPF